MQCIFSNRCISRQNENCQGCSNKQDILSSSQDGFRSNMSTSQALLELVEEITSPLDNKKYSVGILIDLKKAFDTIDHDILAKIFYFYGARGIAHKWLLGYLEDRKQNCLLCTLMTFAKFHKY